MIQRELLRAGRRHRAHFLRWLYAALLTLQVLGLVPQLWTHFDPSRHQLAYTEFIDTFLTFHFALLFILTPALTASAITDEKTHGTLGLLLTAQSRPMDIVLGKLFGRGYQVLMLALVGLPLVAFFGTVGDLHWSFALSFLAITVILVFGLSAVSILASVWCRQTRDAMLGGYLLVLGGVGFVLAGGFTRWAWLANDINPWFAIALDDPELWARRLGRFALIWLVPAGLCVLVAAWRLRPAYLRQIRWTHQTHRRWWHARRPPLRGNPVAWRERYLQGIAPVAWMRLLPRWVGLLAFFSASAAGLSGLIIQVLPARFRNQGLEGVWDGFHHVTPGMAENIIHTYGAVGLSVLWVLVAIRASSCVTEEREKRTWEVLLLSPISTGQIVRGKFWGIVRTFVPYMIVYAGAALGFAYFLGDYALLFATGMLLASLIALTWIAAFGIYCSAWQPTSWRSLLVTLAVSVIGTPALLLPISAGLGCAAAGAVGMLTVLEGLAGPGGAGEDAPKIAFFVVAFLAAAGLTWMIPQVVLRAAVEKINLKERTKVLREFTRQYIDWRIDRAEEKRRERIAQEANNPVPLLDDET
jgi:ABC-type transport system involved in multi-copper enzyme maturation permease subunit